jgi:hypothetical protein
MTFLGAPARGWRRKPFVTAFLGLGFVVYGCTVFDGLTVPLAKIPYPGYLPLEEGIQACRFVHDCPLLSPAIARSIGVPASATRYSMCLSWLAGPLPATRFGLGAQTAMLECIAQADGCPAALACTYVEPLGEGDPRCAGVVGDQCLMDGVLLDCTTELAERCRTPSYGAGSECQLGLAGSGRCALSTCMQETSPPPRCTSGVYVRCDLATNLRVAQDCNTVGLTCPEGAEGADAQCATEDGVFPCDEPGNSVCAPDGTRVRVCDGALASEFDCTAMDGDCQDEPGGARCVRANDACAPGDAGIDVCQGNTISLCVGGTRTTFDCAAVGLACIPPSGQNGGHCG